MPKVNLDSIEQVSRTGYPLGLPDDVHGGEPDAPRDQRTFSGRPSSAFAGGTPRPTGSRSSRRLVSTARRLRPKSWPLAVTASEPAACTSMCTCWP